MRRAVLLSLLAALFVVQAAAGEGGEWSVWEFPNGLRLAVRRMDSAREALAFRYRAGWRYDPPGKEGLAHLVEHLTFGSDAWKTDDFLYTAGGSWGGSTGREFVVFRWEVPARLLSFALDFEKRRLTNRSFDASLLERERRVILAETAGRDRRVLTSLAASADGRPHGGSGSAASLSALTPEDAEAFHSRRYVPGNLEIFVCGGMEPEVVFEEVSRRFGELPASAAAAEPDAPRPRRPVLAVSGKTGAFILPPPRNGREAAAERVVSRALFGLSFSPPVRAFSVEREAADFSLFYPNASAGGMICFHCAGDPVSLWGEVRSLLRRTVEERRTELAELLGAAWNCELADYRRRMLTPGGVLEDVAARGALDAHLSFEDDLYSLGPKDVERTLSLLTGPYERKGGAPSTSGRMERGRAGGRASSAVAARPAGERWKVIRRSKCGVSEVRLFFPDALDLHPAAARVVARTLFHSAREGDEPTGFRFERLGWSWSLEGAVWTFSGLTENVEEALALAAEVVRERRFERGEYGYQSRHDESVLSPLEAAAAEAVSRALSANEGGRTPSFEQARSLSRRFSAARCRVVVETDAAEESVVRGLARRFGTATATAAGRKRSKKRAALEADGPAAFFAEADGGKGQGGFAFAFRGPGWDSPELGPFLAACCALGAGGGLAGPVARLLREEGLYDFEIFLAAGRDNPALVVAAEGPEAPLERAETALSLFFTRLGASPDGSGAPNGLRALRNRLEPARRTFLGSPVFFRLMEMRYGSEPRAFLARQAKACGAQAVRRSLSERFARPLARTMRKHKRHRGAEHD